MCFYNPKQKKSKKEIKEESEEVIAKQITEGDLKKDNKLLVTLVAIFTGIVVLITAIVVFLPYITGSQKHEIPDVSNMTIKEATKELSKYGFEISEEIEESSRDVEENRVIKTNPGAGTIRKSGASVKLYVSIGNKEIEVEDYSGKNFEYIQGKLEGSGIQVLKEKEDIPEGADLEDYDEDVIINQSVEPGEFLSKGDTITLYVPNISNEYPDFSNGTFTLSDILEFCDHYSLKCTFKDAKSKKTLNINNDTLIDYSDAEIKSQNRVEGTKITKGATLTISLDVPSLEQDDEEDDGLD